MSTHHSDPIASTLLAMLDNQRARARAAIEGTPQRVFDAEQAGGCNSIRAIGAHLIDLRRFQLGMLGSARRAMIPPGDAGDTPEVLLASLETADAELRRAIVEYDPADWFAVPVEPRAGKWGDEPTMQRFARPFNDFVSHLGAIRAIRRQMGAGVDRTQ